MQIRPLQLSIMVPRAASPRVEDCFKPQPPAPAPEPPIPPARWRGLQPKLAVGAAAGVLGGLLALSAASRLDGWGGALVGGLCGASLFAGTMVLSIALDEESRSLRFARLATDPAVSMTELVACTLSVALGAGGFLSEALAIEAALGCSLVGAGLSVPLMDIVHQRRSLHYDERLEAYLKQKGRHEEKLAEYERAMNEWSNRSTSTGQGAVLESPSRVVLNGIPLRKKS